MKENKDAIFKVEPGRYLVAECGLLLGTVYSVKKNYDTKHIGADLGFNVLSKPAMYDSYHEISLVKDINDGDKKVKEVTVVGNICESGDIIAKNRILPVMNQGDLIPVENAGAYGFSMSSNYNCRLKPAEILIALKGKID